MIRLDAAGWPFVIAAAVPAAVAALWSPALAGGLLVLPIAIALFFRDPDRTSPTDPAAVLATADGRVMWAGVARAGEAPAGTWQQVTIFLSLFDVHINRTPVPGEVTRVELVPGTFLAAFKREAFQNEHSEIWIRHDGLTVVVRQVVGVLARRVVCRVRPGQRLPTGARIGLMKFGSRMDVFLPDGSEVLVAQGAAVRAGETVIARLPATAR